VAVIKQADSGSIARDAVVLDLGDLQREADRLREKAQAEARAIREKASREADRIIEEAMERGFEEGRKAGAEQGRSAGFEAGRNEAFEQQTSALAALAEQWARALNDFNETRDRLLRDARQDVLELAVRLGERVLRREIEGDRDAATRQLEAALELVLAPTALHVEVSPQDQERIAEILPSLVASLAKSPHAEVVESERVQPGGVRVRTDSGAIDATVEEQLRRISAALRPAGPSPRWPDSTPSEDEDQ
jgi:flagellar biosynthesis/type III secretory pathway protein FliH